MTATTYQVLEPLRHDGGDYAPGDLIHLVDDPGLALVAAGVLALPAIRVGGGEGEGAVPAAPRPATRPKRPTATG